MSSLRDVRLRLGGERERPHDPAAAAGRDAVAALDAVRAAEILRHVEIDLEDIRGNGNHHRFELHRMGFDTGINLSELIETRSVLETALPGEPLHGAVALARPPGNMDWTSRGA